MNIRFNKAFQLPVIISAAKVALVVGPVITLVNQWDYLLAGQLNTLKLILSFLIPYTVSTVSFLLASSAFESRFKKSELRQLLKRLDGLIVVLEQPHNRSHLLALNCKNNTLSTDKPLDLLAELKHLQVVSK